jgi:hypothetical protein
LLPATRSASTRAASSNGTSGIETELGGVGVGTLVGCAAAGTVTYTRTDPLVQVTGKVTVNGVCHNILTSPLVFVPTSDPVTTGRVPA